jgi:predicted nuclease of predicted toxin-antitoxin system
MRYLIDAQLPQRLSNQLREAGYDCIHTLSLPQQNKTSDAEIMNIADLEGRIVVTKDSDFVVSHVLRNIPQKLLLISTGNIANSALLPLILRNMNQMNIAFATSSFIEITNESVVLRD